MTNAIVWFDIPTLDFERAIKFYSTILDKEIKPQEFGGMTLAFFPMEGQDGVGGDIVPPSDEYKPSTHGSRVYLNCNGALDDILARVEPAGGKVLQQKFFMEGAGWLATIIDSEGNCVGLHSN